MIVVLVLSIIAAVAAPKMFNTANDASESATRLSLAVLRNAIELYRAQNGSYPPSATIQAELRPFLSGPFPAPQVGNQNSGVKESSEDPITGETGSEGWAYNPTTGQIVILDAAYMSW